MDEFFKAVGIGDPIGNAILIGDFFGFLLALPMALFLTFWMSAVKNWKAVVAGAFIGTVLGFLILWLWIWNPFGSAPLQGANGVATFFGSVLFCSVTGIAGGIITDLLVARANTRDYRRQSAHQH